MEDNVFKFLVALAGVAILVFLFAAITNSLDANMIVATRYCSPTERVVKYDDGGYCTQYYNQYNNHDFAIGWVTTGCGYHLRTLCSPEEDDSGE